jgi:SPP1 gp7 family putative phage head morphogenesis protein
MPAILLEPQPHAEAARQIQDKPVVTREVFEAMLPELRARAFLVTGIEDANVVAEIRDTLSELPRGETWENVKAALVDQLSAWLADDDGMSASARAQLLMRTHGFQAYQAAQHQIMDQQAGVFEHWQYLSLDDEKVRPAHRALHEVIAPANDPFWSDHSPPWQWGCRCRKVPLLPEEVEDIRRQESTAAPFRRKILEGTRLKLARQGRLDLGPNQGVDIRSDRTRGKDNPFVFDPGSLRIPVAQLRDRYDPETWSQFEAYARSASLPDGRNLWTWLNQPAGSAGTN